MRPAHRPADPNKAEARWLYRQGSTTEEILEKLPIPAQRLRRWVRDEKWTRDPPEPPRPKQPSWEVRQEHGWTYYTWMDGGHAA